jgi:hypothetical protein
MIAYCTQYTDRECREEDCCLGNPNLNPLTATQIKNRINKLHEKKMRGHNARINDEE